MKYKLYSSILAVCLSLGPLLGGCAAAGASSEASPAPAASAVQPQAADEDFDTSWDESATKITLNGATASVDGSGATATGDGVTISAAGTYVLSGTLDNGQVLVEAGSDDLVRLVLNGAGIHNEDSAPIYCARARKLVVILEDGTENTLTDGGTQYAYGNEEKEEPDAALFAKDDMTINGSGRLTVEAGFNNGIGCKDNLLLVSGSVTVTAENHAIRGRDSLTVLDGVYTLAAGNDGLQSNNDSGADVGWISIQGGAFNITAGHDAVQAESSLTVEDGSFTVVTAGGHTASVPGAAEDTSDSYKGLKAGTDIVISGGSFNLDTLDDAVHGNGSVTITAGTFAISTGDDGVHADEDLLISGGDIDIAQSYEGLEGATVTISGGTIQLVASDDGINAAGGSDSTGGGGMFGGDRFGGGNVSEDWWISFEGGEVTIYADGDGFDSNGGVRMSGGTVWVHGPTSGADAAVDYELEFELTGGTMAAAGSAGMAMAATASVSTQPSVLLYYSGTQSAGTTVSVQDADGTEVLSFTPEKDYTTIFLTTGGFVQGEAYTIYADGTEVITHTLEDMVTSIRDTGEAVSGMGGFGGAGPGGGMGGSRGTGEGGFGGGTPPDGMEPPDGFELPEDFEMPDGEMPRGGGRRPGQ